MSSPIQLRPAEEHDLATIAALKVAGFQYSPYQQALWPSHLRQKPGTQDQVEWTLSQLHGTLGRPRMRLMVAVDKTSGEERIAGYAEWISPQSQPDVKSGGSQHTERAIPPKMPESLDVDAMRKGSDEISHMLRGDDCIAAFKGKDRDRMWTLNSIAVDLDYRGRGIAKMLTKWALDEADAVNEGVWLIASPLGRRLYEGLGFTEVAAGSRFGEGQYVMTRF